MKKKNVSQANTLEGRNDSDWSSFLGGFNVPIVFDGVGGGDTVRSVL